MFYLFSLGHSLIPMSAALSFHRRLCLLSTLFLIAVLVLHAAPGIIYTIFTRHSPPIPHPTLSIVGHCRTATLLFTLLSVASMRRGPRLRYEPMKLGTSFGMNADPADPRPKPKANEDEVDAESEGDVHEEEVRSNVLDYQNSSMLDFVFLTYVRDTRS